MQNAQSTHENSPTQQFSDFKTLLREQFGEAIYDSYFDGLSLAEADEAGVTLYAPSRFSATLISQRFAGRMHQMWSERYGPVPDLRVRGAQDTGALGVQAGLSPDPSQPAGRSRPVQQTRSAQNDAAASSFDCAATGIFARGMIPPNLQIGRSERLKKP
ncbi:MAG: DnaA N-terminal domain-containing protein [Pseudomonadota bacterium]